MFQSQLSFLNEIRSSLNQHAIAITYSHRTSISNVIAMISWNLQVLQSEQDSVTAVARQQTNILPHPGYISSLTTINHSIGFHHFHWVIHHLKYPDMTTTMLPYNYQNVKSLQLPWKKPKKFLLDSREFSYCGYECDLVSCWNEEMCCSVV